MFLSAYFGVIIDLNEWITVKEAAESLKCSTRYVRNRAASGKLRAKKEGNVWLIHSSLSTPSESDMESKGTDKESSAESERITALSTENQWLKERIETQEKELSELRKELSESGNRHDTIVMQLTRQLEQSQRMLESKRSSLFRRLFHRKD